MWKRKVQMPLFDDPAKCLDGVHILVADDSSTKSVVVHLEAVCEARGFMSALRALATIKPVVVLKAGRDGTTPREVASYLVHAVTSEKAAAA